MQEHFTCYQSSSESSTTALRDARREADNEDVLAEWDTEDRDVPFTSLAAPEPVDWADLGVAEVPA